MNTNTPTEVTSIAALIQERQTALDMSDEDLAFTMGMEQKIVTAMKRRQVKVPVGMVMKLAGALSINPAELLRRLLSEYMPEVMEAVDALITPFSLTSNEAELIRSFRYLAKGHDVQPILMDGNSIIALVAA